MKSWNIYKISQIFCLSFFLFFLFSFSSFIFSKSAECGNKQNLLGPWTENLNKNWTWNKQICSQIKKLDYGCGIWKLYNFNRLSVCESPTYEFVFTVSFYYTAHTKLLTIPFSSIILISHKVQIIHKQVNSHFTSLHIGEYFLIYTNCKVTIHR